MGTGSGEQGRGAGRGIGDGEQGRGVGTVRRDGERGWGSGVGWLGVLCVSALAEPVYECNPIGRQ